MSTLTDKMEQSGMFTRSSFVSSDAIEQAPNLSRFLEMTYPVFKRMMENAAYMRTMNLFYGTRHWQFICPPSNETGFIDMINNVFVESINDLLLSKNNVNIYVTDFFSDSNLTLDSINVTKMDDNGYTIDCLMRGTDNSRPVMPQGKYTRLERLITELRDMSYDIIDKIKIHHYLYDDIIDFENKAHRMCCIMEVLKHIANNNDIISTWLHKDIALKI